MKIYFKSVIMCIVIIVFLMSAVFANPFSDYLSNNTANQEIEDIGQNVIGIINVVGAVIAICVLIFIGIKIMIASPDEKAQLKGTLTPYIVGATLLFASTSIANVIYTITKRSF